MNVRLKYYFLLLALLSLQYTSEAKKKKEGELPKFRHGVSLNILEPTLKVLSKSTNVIDSSTSIKAPTIYYHYLTRKMSYRVGLRVSSKSQRSKSDLLTGFEKMESRRYDVVLSALRRKEISTKLQYAYGVFASPYLSQEKKIFDSGFDQVSFNLKSLSATAGLNALLQYNINDRLSLFTEYLLGYQLIKTTNDTEFSAFPEENYNKSTLTTRGFQFDYPITVYITYHF